MKQKGKRFREEQIVYALREVQGGRKIAEICRWSRLREGDLTLADEWPSLPVAKKREIVETIVTSIVIEGDSVAFNLAFDLKDFCKKSTQWSG